MLHIIRKVAVSCDFKSTGSGLEIFSRAKVTTTFTFLFLGGTKMASSVRCRVRTLCGNARYNRRFLSLSFLRSAASCTVTTDVRSCLIDMPSLRVTELPIRAVWLFLPSGAP